MSVMLNKVYAPHLEAPIINKIMDLSSCPSLSHEWTTLNFETILPNEINELISEKNTILPHMETNEGDMSIICMKRMVYHPIR